MRMVSGAIVIVAAAILGVGGAASAGIAGDACMGCGVLLGLVGLAILAWGAIMEGQLRETLAALRKSPPKPPVQVPEEESKEDS